MNVPVTPFLWTMAVLPLLILLILMVGFHWGAVKAAPVGMTLTAVVGIVFYKADIQLIAVESVKGVWNAFVILLIVCSAVLLYQVGNEARAFAAIREGMKKLLPNELVLLLAMGWVFESFLQGITGFGVPVAVGAPLLIGIGVKPVWAVIIPLLGQSWGNTFGTLGAAWDALAMTTGLTIGSEGYILTALFAAAFLWIWNGIIGVTICWFYGRWEAVKKGSLAILLLSAIQGGGELLLSSMNTTIACFIPACVSLGAVLCLGKGKRYGFDWKVEKSPIMDRALFQEKQGEEQRMSFFDALVPYILLSGITIFVLAVSPVKEVLGQISVGFSFSETSTGYGFINEAVECFSPITPFTHASMFLFISSIIGFIYYRKKGYIANGGGRRIVVNALAMAMPSGVAVTGLVVMSKIMAGTGQTVVLASAAAQTLGKAYVIFAPFIGLLGSFMTGSNMSSNILFGGFQAMTADMLNMNSACILGAQTAGGSIGSVVSPSNIVLGAATAGVLGLEGEILKKTSFIVIPIALLMGGIVFACAV